MKKFIKNWLFIAKVFYKRIIVFLVLLVIDILLLMVLPPKYSFTVIFGSVIIYIAITDWISS